jgi:hypothetical protein
MITTLSAAPVYSMWDFYLGSGVVGGFMASSHDQGLTAGRLALGILETGRIPPVVLSSPNAAIFDYPLLARHGLDPELLPDDVEIIGRPDVKRWPVIPGITFTSMLAAFF